MRHGLYRTMSARCERCETLHNINHAQEGDLPVVTRQVTATDG
jgi:hypothetical protein